MGNRRGVMLQNEQIISNLASLKYFRRRSIESCNKHVGRNVRKGETRVLWKWCLVSPQLLNGNWPSIRAYMVNSEVLGDKTRQNHDNELCDGNISRHRFAALLSEQVSACCCLFARLPKRAQCKFAASGYTKSLRVLKYIGTARKAFWRSDWLPFTLPLFTLRQLAADLCLNLPFVGLAREKPDSVELYNMPVSWLRNGKS